MNNLANLYSDQGRYEEAEPLYVDALRLHKEKLGEEHPDTIISMNNLAVLYRKQALYVDALRLRKEKLGNEHPDTKQ